MGWLSPHEQQCITNEDKSDIKQLFKSTQTVQNKHH